MVTPSTDTSIDNNGLSQQPYYMNGKIIISALIILLLIVLFIMALHIYAKCFGRRRISSRRIGATTATVWHYAQESHASPAAAAGLDKAVVDAMPVFVFKALPSKASSMASTAVECSVCLSEFQNDEKCRLLPNCGHSFHTECIDKWFLSNTTCPLCRTEAEPHASDSIQPGFQPLETIAMPENVELSNIGVTAEGASGSRAGHGSLDDISATALLLQRTINANARSWHRSISDRFTGVSESVQFPTNVLFWGNHSHMSSRVNSDHWQIGGRSMPHIVIDVDGAAQQQEGLLAGLPMQRPSSPSTRPFQRFKSLRRLLSREKKVLVAEDEAASCSCSHSALPNT